MKDKWKWAQSADGKTGTTLSSLPFGNAATTSMQLCHANEAYKALMASNPPSLSLAFYRAIISREKQIYEDVRGLCGNNNDDDELV